MAVNSLPKNSVRQLPVFIFDNTRSRCGRYTKWLRAHRFSVYDPPTLNGELGLRAKFFSYKHIRVVYTFFRVHVQGDRWKNSRGRPKVTSPREGPLRTFVYTTAVSDDRPAVDDEFIIRARKNVIAYGSRLSPIIFFIQTPRWVFCGRRDPIVLFRSNRYFIYESTRVWSMFFNQYPLCTVLTWPRKNDSYCLLAFFWIYLNAVVVVRGLIFLRCIRIITDCVVHFLQKKKIINQLLPVTSKSRLNQSYA